MSFIIKPVYPARADCKKIKAWNTKENAIDYEFFRLCKRFFYRSVHPNDKDYYYRIKDIVYTFQQNHLKCRSAENKIINSFLYKDSLRLMRQIHPYPNYTRPVVSFFIFLIANIEYLDDYDYEPYNDEYSNLQNEYGTTKSILTILKDNKFTWTHLNDHAFWPDDSMHDPYGALCEFLTELCYILGKWCENILEKTDSNWDEFIVIMSKYGLETNDPLFENELERIYQYLNNFDLGKYKIEDFFRKKSSYTAGDYKGINYLLIYSTAKLIYENSDKTLLEKYKNFIKIIVKYLNKHFVDVKIEENKLDCIMNDLTNATKLINDIHETFEFYDPEYCKFINKDIYTQVKFKDFPLLEIHKIINIAGGKCYTYTYLAQILIVYKSPSKIDISHKYFDMLSRELAKYFTKNIDDYNDLLDYIDLLEDSYLKYSRNIPDDNIKCSKTVLKGLSDKNLCEKTRNDILKKFFTIMFFHYQQNIIDRDAETILNSSLGTLSNLTGLLGYILYSDDVTNWEVNQDAKHFQISSYCIQLFKEFTEQHILETISKNITDIINQSTNECIHAKGIKLLSYFVKMTTNIQQIIESYKMAITLYYDTNNKNKETCSAFKEVQDKLIKLGIKINPEEKTIEQSLEDINNIFIIPPFLIPTTPEIFAKTGFRYMTCIRTDILYKKHPLLDEYLVSFFKEDGTHFRLVKIDCKKTYAKSEQLITALDFLYDNPENGGSNSPSISPMENTQTAVTLAQYIYNNFHIKKELIKVAYTFQRERAQLFTLYKAHTENIIELLKEPIETKDKRHQIINICKTQTIYDFINLEEIIAPYQLLSIIRIDDEGKNGHMYGNSADKFTDDQNDTCDTNKYHIDLLENIVSLKYVPNSSEDKKPTVFLPHIKKDITRQYEYSKILGRMFFKNMYFNQITAPKPTYSMDEFTPFIEDKFSSFQDYFKHCFGQESYFADVIFNNIKIEIGGHTYTKSTFKKMIIEIFNIPGLQISLCALLLDAADIVEKIRLTNAPIILKELIDVYNRIKKYNEPGDTPITKSIENLINDILVRMRVFMYLANVYYKYIIVVYPKPWPFSIGGADIDPIKYASQWYLKPVDMTIETINYLAEKYHITLYYIINTICPYGNQVNTYQYHYTELSKEIYFIKYIRDKLNSTRAANVGSLSEISTPNFLEKFQTSHDIIGNILNNYKDVKDKDTTPLQLRLHDEQESIRLRFEYLLKADLVDIHMERMIHFRHLEEILGLLYNNPAAAITNETQLTHLKGDIDILSKYISKKCNKQKLYNFIYDDYILRYIVASNDQAHIVLYTIINQLHANYEKHVSLDESTPITSLELNRIFENYDKYNPTILFEIYKKMYIITSASSNINHIHNNTILIGLLEDKPDSEERKNIISNIITEYIQVLEQYFINFTNSDLIKNEIVYSYIFLYCCCKISDFNSFQNNTDHLSKIIDDLINRLSNNENIQPNQ